MVRRLAQFLLLALLAVLAAPPGRAQGPELSASPSVEAGYAARVVARVNLHRREAGLGPVRSNDALARAASDHARAMAEEDFFTHESPDGSGFSDRAARAGYSWRMIAENIAAGLETPEATVDGWMDSEGHRRNMLTARFVDAGVGYASIHPDPGDVRYGHYWVLMLGAPQQSHR